MRSPARCSRPMLGRAWFSPYCQSPRPTACVMARFERQFWPPGEGVAIMLIGRVARGSCWGHYRVSFGPLVCRSGCSGRGTGASVQWACSRTREAPWVWRRPSSCGPARTGPSGSYMDMVPLKAIYTATATGLVLQIAVLAKGGRDGGPGRSRCNKRRSTSRRL